MLSINHALLQVIGHKKYSLLGWSDGGMTAMIMAARFPDRVRKLVVWGSASHVTKEDVDNYDKMRDINKWSEEMREPFLKLYGEEHFRKLWNENLDAYKVYYDTKQGDALKF